MRKIIVIFDAARLQHFLKQSSENYLCFIGCDRDEALNALVQSGRLLEIPRDPLSAEFKESFCKEYAKTIGDVGARNNHVRWWASFIASKNRFHSRVPEKLFQLYSIVTALKRSPEAPMVLINPERSVVLALGNIFGKSVVIYGEQAYQRYYAATKAWLQSLLSKFEVVISLCMRHFRARWYLGSYVKKNLSAQEQYVLIKTFVYQQSFDAENKYRDAFFEVLPHYLAQRGKKVVIIGNVVGDYQRIVKQIALSKSDALLIPQEYFLSLGDLVVAVWRLLLSPRRLQGPNEFFGWDVTGIIQSDFDCDYQKGYPFRQYAYFFIMKNILKVAQIDTFYMPYENNPWERMFTLALRSFSPQTKIVGYQHTVVPQASANMFLSKQEEAVAPLPDVVLTVGDLPIQILKKYGHYERVKLKQACALRFDYLFHLPMQPRTNHKRLLIALEGVLPVSDVVNYVLEQYPKECGLQLVIRTHPALPLSAFRSRINYAFETMKHVTLSTNQLLKDDIMASDIVMYWGSSVGLEALMMGKPVIHFDNQTLLSYDPLFENPHFKWVVAKDANLSKVIESIYALNDETFSLEQKKGREYIERYFFPVSEQGLQVFLNA